jgi:hypothetical protein
MNYFAGIMFGFTVSYLMAIVDFIPVVLFMAAMAYVIKMAFGRIKTIYFAILTGGVFVSFMGGLAKCTWKLIYAHGVDFVPLNTAFVLYQTAGFLLIAIGVFVLLLADIKQSKKSVGTVVASASTLPIFLIVGIIEVVTIDKPGFLWYIVMALFTVIYLVTLSVIAFRHRNFKSAFLFYGSMIFMFGMVALRSKFDEGGSWENINWVAQICNSLTQLQLLLACLFLSKSVVPIKTPCKA